MGRRRRNSRAIKEIIITIGDVVELFVLRKENLIDRKEACQRVRSLHDLAQQYISETQRNQMNQQAMFIGPDSVDKGEPGQSSQQP
jgi:hypothetical protein